MIVYAYDGGFIPPVSYFESRTLNLGQWELEEKSKSAGELPKPFPPEYRCLKGDISLMFWILLCYVGHLELLGSGRKIS